MESKDRSGIRKKRVFICIGIVIGVLLYMLFLIVLNSHISITSDQANHLLQADDILSGNFFMRDWILTGITFFTTDLLYYEVGRILCGISPEAVYVAVGAMAASTLIAAYLASVAGEKKYLKLKTFLFAMLMLIPCRNALGALRIHTGAVFYSIVSFLLVYKTLGSNTETNDVHTKKRKILVMSLLFIVSLFGAIGDFLFVVEGAIPICLVCFFWLLSTDKSSDKKMPCMLIGIIILAVVCAALWEKVFFAIGGADKNSYMEEILFIDLTKWGDKFSSMAKQIMDMCMGAFYKGEVANFWNLIKSINFLGILVSAVFVIKYLWQLIRQKIRELDLISVLMSLSIIVALAASLLTDRSAAVYITIVPIAFGVVLLRNIESLINSVNNKRLFIAVIALLAFLSFAGKIKEISSYIKNELHTSEYALVEVLEEQGLKNGYGSFWDASIITILSQNHTTVRHIRYEENVVAMWKWFAKREWYQQDAEFIVINKSSEDTDFLQIAEANMLNVFGEPSKRIEIDKYLVLVYDYDLSQKLGDLPK